MSTPSPTPSKGAMLAANAISCTVQGTGWSENEEAHAARIIDNATLAKELAASLQKMLDLVGWIQACGGLRLGREVIAEAKSLLAKIQESK